MKTIVYIGHPELTESSSQQFLLSSGKALTKTTFVDLQQEYNEQQAFNVQAEQERLLNHDRIIFQFHLYWYSAPAIMKLWLDSVWEDRYQNPAFVKQMALKELGLVVVAGVKEAHYQAGGREGRSLSELLSPYETLAGYFQMKYLAPFGVHQFNRLSEKAKMSLMYRYACFLAEGTAISEQTYQAFIIEQLNQLSADNLPLSAFDQQLFELWRNQFEEQAEELNELYRLTEGW